ncbi:MAG: Do family serine endopeptidase [Deltaproteobacteria bacterium]|nr:Do family serine endopeptidase [Deltaproteobacteria bacterium]
MRDTKKGYGLAALAAVAVISVIAGVVLSAKLNWTSSSDAVSFWKESSNGKPIAASVSPGANFVELASKLSPTVVNISTTQVINQRERPVVPFPDFKAPFDDFFGDDFNKFFNAPRGEFKRQSLGSGFIINKDGYILTNQHVIDNATEILVTLSESKKDYKAAVIGQDRKLDIALIKIEAGNLPSVTIGDSEALQVGEWVMAIGNPFGLGGTVTAGIVSQKGRVIGAGPYDNFIQTDASINPGNSGGPLFNVRGEVVGINTAIIAGGQGIGFATPINMVKDILMQLKEKGKITRGWIGVSVQELTPELAANFGLKDTKGTLISSVNAGEPADVAGLKAGDIITTFDNKPVNDLSDLPRTVANTAPGKNAVIKVVRDGKELTLTVKVGTRTEEEGEETAAKTDEHDQSPDMKFGLSAGPITPEMGRRLGITETDGVIITSIRPDSPAGDAGLRRGDVIKEINRAQIKDIKDYNRAIADAGKKDSALFLVVRGDSAIYVALKLK